MDDSQVKEALDFAIDVARAAGRMIAEASAQRSATVGTAATKEKKNSVDLVTETDEAVERYVSQRIRDKYPTHEFIGEETYSSGTHTVLGDGPTWAVDPVDGTTNFVHAFPFVACSIGLFDGGVPVVGVVYNPFLDQLYSAARGCGAYLNGTQRLPLVAPAPLTHVQGALLAAEWGSERAAGPGAGARSNFEVKRDTFAHVLSEQGAMAHGLRSLGSVACAMCLVAAGQLDAMWEGGCWIWDVAAASCILNESGGLITSSDCPADASPLRGSGYEARRYMAVRATANGRPDQQSFVRDFKTYMQGNLEY